MKLNNNKMSHLNRGYSKEYEMFFKYLLDSSKTIPNTGTKYIPQGICVVEDNVLITAYDEEKKDNSIIYLINNNGYQKKIILDGKYHGGGISYDKNNNIYITGYGSDKGLSYVNVYNYNDILSYDDSSRSKLKLVNKIKVDESFDLLSSASRNKISSPAYLYIHNNYLYVGNYHTNKSIIKRYIIKENNTIDETSYKTIKNPFFYTQGMCIYNLDDIDYYIFSSSKGRKNNSKLYIASLNNNNLIKVGEITLPSMAEQVCDIDNKIAIIFESGARKYYNTAKNVVNSICYLDIKKIIKDLCK